MSIVEQQNKQKNDIAIISVLSNVLLVALKFVIGILIGSVSVISEAIHSGVDLIAAIIAFLSVRRSSRPPDEDHTFGHGKYENVAGVIEALLIVVAAVLIIREAINDLLYGSTMEDVTWGIAIMAFSTVVNYLVGWKQLQVARDTGSIAMEADALHHNTDVLTSLGIFAGLVVIKFTGLTWLDPAIAILVALLILGTAIQLTIKSVKDLMDANLPREDVAEIERIIKEHSETYAGFHELRTRRSGSDRFVDLHLVVSQDMSVKESHSLADHIEKDIIERFPRTSVITHIEPCDNGATCRSCQATSCSKYAAIHEIVAIDA